MRKSYLGLGLGAMALLLAGVAMAGEAPEATTIDDCVAKKSAVEFPHAAHFEVTECTTCHHTRRMPRIRQGLMKRIDRYEGRSENSRFDLSSRDPS